MLPTNLQTMKLVIYVAKMQQILFFVHQLMMNDNFPNRKCVLRKCTACTSISLPGVEIYSSNRAPMIMFKTYMTQFNCSHHGIIIRKKITPYLDEKGTSKNTCFLCEQLIQSKTPDFTRGGLYERVKLFSVHHRIDDFYKYFYIQQIEKLA